MCPRITETTPRAPSGPFHFGDRSALGLSEIEQDCRREENRGAQALAVAMWIAIGLGVFILSALCIYALGVDRSPGG